MTSGSMQASGLTILRVVVGIVFLVHWVVLSVDSGISLWRAGRAQPAVARRRMQLLSFASIALAVALLLALPTSGANSGYALATQVLGFVAVLGFLTGFEPP